VTAQPPDDTGLAGQPRVQRRAGGLPSFHPSAIANSRPAAPASAIFFLPSASAASKPASSFFAWSVLPTAAAIMFRSDRMRPRLSVASLPLVTSTGTYFSS
jgi:hypothetical protein